ncbi:VCBS repeat-containing protein [candidate division KSB1 bacterium]|nr:VCBS repeat-containing protein [candidate division KSB1 bacterium]
MSRKRKIGIAIILVIIVLVALYLVCRLMDRKTIYDCIPDDSMLTLTVHNPVKVWQEFESSQVWNRFKTMQLARDIRLSLDAINKRVGNERNKKLLELIFHEQITIASNDFETFVLYADIGFKSELVRMLDLGKELLVTRSNDVRLSEETVNGRTVNRIELLKDRKSYAYAVVGNILIAGDDENLVRKSVMAADQLVRRYSDNKAIHRLEDRIDREHKLRLYLNMRELNVDELMVESVHPLFNEITDAVEYMGLGLMWDDHGVTLNMVSPFQHDQPHRLLEKMSVSVSDNIPPISVIPQDAENVISIRLGKFETIRSFTEEQMRKDPDTWREYEQSRKMVEQDFGISLDRDIFSWIGDHVGTFGFPLENKEKLSQVLWIRASDASKAEQSLKRIKKALEKKLPIVFKDRVHKDVAISYIDLPLYLKIIFNPIFQKISKPYWMVVKDMVFFSDDIESLTAVVDTYRGDQTIEDDVNFELMEKSLSFDSNLFLFAQMKPSLQYIKGFLNRSAAAAINKWQPYLLKFRLVGLNSNVKDDEVAAKLYLKLADADEAPIHLRWKIGTQAKISCPIASGQFDALVGDELVIADESGKLQVVSSEATAMKGWPRYFEDAITIPLAIGDLNDDSRDDLVVITNKNIYTLDRSGNLLNSAWPLKLNNPVITYPVLSDIDDDGGDDLIYISDHRYINIVNDRAIPLAGWPQMTAGPIRSAPAVGDMDGDDSYEVVVATANGLVYVYDSKGRVLAPWPRSTNSAISVPPTVADIDGDKTLDIIIVTIDGHIFVWSFGGYSVSGWPQSLGTMTNGYPAVGDINGDGKPEIVIGAEDHKVYLFDSGGERVVNWPQRTLGKIRSEPVLGDVNGDGQADVVVASDDGKLYAWNLSGELIPGWPLQGSESPVLGDFDGDGLIDIVVGSWDQHCYYWGLNGEHRRHSIVWGQFRYDKANTGLKPVTR